MSEKMKKAGEEYLREVHEETVEFSSEIFHTIMGDLSIAWDCGYCKALDHVIELIGNDHYLVPKIREELDERGPPLTDDEAEKQLKEFEDQVNETLNKN